MLKEDIAFPAAATAIIDRQRVRWQALIDQLNVLDLKETENALTMGDLFVLIEREFGAKSMKEAAAGANIAWGTAYSRYRVSKKIPKDSPLRERPLSYAQFRAIADTEEPEEWADRCMAEQLSTSQLMEAIRREGDGQAVSTGQPCIQCNQSMADSGETIVAFSIGNGKRARCCNPECALAYFEEYVREKDQDGEEEQDPLADQE